METKNEIIYNYTASVIDAANSISGAVNRLGDNVDINNSVIRTIDVLLETLRSQTLILQDAVDKYISKE